MLGVLEQEACAVGGSVCPRHVENVEGVRLPVEVPLPWLSPGHQGVVQADPESGHDQCALRPCKAAGGLGERAGTLNQLDHRNRCRFVHSYPTGTDPAGCTCHGDRFHARLSSSGKTGGGH